MIERFIQFWDVFIVFGLVCDLRYRNTTDNVSSAKTSVCERIQNHKVSQVQFSSLACARSQEYS